MKRSFLLGALTIRALLGFGCDQCGCSLLSGVQPYERTNNFGLQYRMRYLDGDVANSPVAIAKHGGAEHSGSTKPFSSYTEIFYVLDLRGQFWLSDRVSLMASVPVVNNYKVIDDVLHADITGLGDPLLMARYELFNNAFSADTASLVQRFTIGAGAKLPLGRNDLEQYGEVLDPDLQPGTGTWDALVSLEYQLRKDRWGFASGSMARINGTNDDGHRFGHSVSGTIEVFRAITLGRVKWYPSIGGYAEYAAKDRNNDIVDVGTGGSVLFSHIGSRFWWRSLGLSLTWQHALVQDLGALMIPNRERLLVGLTCNL